MMSPDRSSAVLLTKSDAFLVALARRGSNAAFAAIVARYRPEVERYCQRFLARERAEDAAQQTFVRALRALRADTEVRELRPWLYRIARNVALNELADHGWDYDELEITPENHACEDVVETRAAVREALGAVASLPDRQRTALLLSVLDGLSPAVIGAQLGVSACAARQLVHRARASVRAAVRAVVPVPLVALSRKLVEVSRAVPATVGSAPKLTALAAAGAVAAPLPLGAIGNWRAPRGRGGDAPAAAPAARAESSAALTSFALTAGAATTGAASASTEHRGADPGTASSGGGGFAGRLSSSEGDSPAVSPTSGSPPAAPPPSPANSGSAADGANDAAPSADVSSPGGDVGAPATSPYDGGDGSRADAGIPTAAAADVPSSVDPSSAGSPGTGGGMDASRTSGDSAGVARSPADGGSDGATGSVSTDSAASGDAGATGNGSSSNDGSSTGEGTSAGESLATGTADGAPPG